MSPWIWALLAFFLAVAIQTGEAIRCYECNSERDYTCGDPFQYSNLALTECERGHSGHNGYSGGQRFVCKKVKKRMNGKIEVERSCAVEGFGSSSPCAHGVYGYTEHCSYCSWDGCNGASGITPTYWILVTSAITYASVKCL